MTVQDSCYHHRQQCIQTWLDKNKLDAFIFPHEDEYLSEYIPVHNERLAWLTGFTGSAGIAIVTRHNAAIFVDGRYTIQVKKQVSADLFEYRHLIDEPALAWLSAQCDEKIKLGFDPRLHTANWLNQASEKYADKLIFVPVEQNPVDIHWQDRPKPIISNAILLDTSITGRNSETKRNLVGQELKKQDAKFALITQLDSICWLLNIRGSDIPRLPVLLSTLIIDENGDVTFFIDEDRLPENFPIHVGQGVKVSPPSSLPYFFTTLTDKRILVDPQTSNAWASALLEMHKVHLIQSQDPCLLLKATKNEAEINGMKNCHIKDGVAVCRFLSWLDNEIKSDHLHDEAVLADKLFTFRQEEPTLKDLSFDTISAAAENAAMCHYRHSDQPIPGKLKRHNVYLVDSGGQYLNGTTDITRTVGIDDCPDLIKKTFTLVLKGHIALSQVQFPKGTTGSQLDALARQYLWAEGFDYDHGTGHGVGHFLSVHEGPQRISKVANNTPLLPGMVLSNEPGYYRTDSFGIRIENLEVVVEVETNGDRSLLGFETLTRAPIDKNLIEKTCLTEREICWLNAYHQKVWQEISPHLTDDDKAWLEKATSAI